MSLIEAALAFNLLSTIDQFLDFLNSALAGLFELSVGQKSRIFFQMLVVAISQSCGGQSANLGEDVRYAALEVLDLILKLKLLLF